MTRMPIVDDCVIVCICGFGLAQNIDSASAEAAWNDGVPQLSLPK